MDTLKDDADIAVIGDRVRFRTVNGMIEGRVVNDIGGGYYEVDTGGGVVKVSYKSLLILKRG